MTNGLIGSGRLEHGKLELDAPSPEAFLPVSSPYPYDAKLAVSMPACKAPSMDLLLILSDAARKPAF